MANEFPASQLLVSRAVEQYASIARSVKNLAQHSSTKMAAGNYAANLVIDLWERLKTGKAQLQAIAATPRGLLDTLAGTIT